MDHFRQDIAYALRTVSKHPSFAIVAVLVLALGIGANISVFSVVNAVLLRPLPYRDSDKLVQVWVKDAKRPSQLDSPRFSEFLEWKRRSRTLEGIEIYRSQTLVLAEGDEPVRISGAIASVGLFPLLGIEPIVGRTFLPEEGWSGQNSVIILSHGLWQRAFGLDPDLIGRGIRFNDPSGPGKKIYIVVGIMSPEFTFPTSEVSFWIPWVLEGDSEYKPRFVTPIGRIKERFTLKQTQAELNTLAVPLVERGGEHKASGVVLRTLLEGNVRHVQRTLLVLWGAVGFVLVITCANVANLLLTRATTREKEIAIRSVLGASYWRLIKQSLAESILLSFLGGALGLLLAFWCVRAMVAIRPESFFLPRFDEVSIDVTVVVFMVGLSVLTSIVFGLAPALQSARPDLVDSLKRGGTTSGGGGRSQTRNFLVVVEVALTLVLLVGAGLIIHNFLLLQYQDLGFDTENILSLRVDLPRNRYSDRFQQHFFYQQLSERLGALPGVESVTMATAVPMTVARGSGDLVALGKQRPTKRKDWHSAKHVSVSPDYFRVMGIPLLKGRLFTEEDNETTTPVILISQTLAQRYWLDEDPINKYMISLFSGDPTPHKIVGVVGDVMYDGIEWKVDPFFYVPYQQAAKNSSMSFVVRAQTEPSSLLPAVKSQVWSLDKDLPVENIGTMEQHLTRWLVQPRFYLVLFGVFAALALTIATVGVYGVIAYSVSQRTHEIGVRMALGAHRGNILAMVLRQGMTLVGIGLAVGLLASYWLTRFLKSFLFEVEPTDPATFVVVSLVLSATALLACYIPAWRASRLNPMDALRYE